MTNNQKILFVSVGVIGLGLYFFNKKNKQDTELELEKESESDYNTNENTNNESIPNVSTKTDWDKILKKGSKGIEVKLLQKSLKQLDVDGDFGTKTETRLRNVTGLNQISLNQYNYVIRNKK